MPQTANALLAQAAASNAVGGNSTVGNTDGFFEIVLSGGAVGLAIVLLLAGLSMAALALVVEHLLTIRRAVLSPPGLADGVAKRLGEADLKATAAACDLQPSFLANVVRAGIGETDSGWPAVEKAMEDAAAENAARLFRKIEYLSVIGNIAPMVGLLGTVVGMIFAFQEVANTQGAARAAELASGIYQALVTTVGGLIVAIPSLAAFAIFRNRVDGLVAATAHDATRATRPLKRMMIEGGRRKAEGART
ncbi:MAG: MotA/TolQ/ExbB proton channel family protein [Planctomycetota bacterium]